MRCKKMDRASLVCIVSIAVCIVAPWYKSSYSLVENTLVRLLLIVALLGAVRLGPLPGLFTLLAVITLLIERNQYVVTHLPYQAASAELHVKEDRVVQAPFAAVQEEEVKAAPHEEEEMQFADSNPRLPAGPPATQAVAFYTGKGLA